MDREALAQAIEAVAASVRLGQTSGVLVVVRHGVAGRVTGCADWDDTADMVRCVSAVLRTMAEAPDQQTTTEVH